MANREGSEGSEGYRSAMPTVAWAALWLLSIICFVIFTLAWCHRDRR